MAIETGITIGRYRLLEPLGRGGMGGVWACVDEAGNRYALKSPATGVRADAVLMKRFAREANALRMIDHPNLVAAIDVFVDGDSLYLVMELVPGRTLGKLLAHGPLQARRALVLARQMLDGISHAHAQGLVHRDLKPDNVMLVDMGGWERAKIVDFGLVKLIGEAEAAMGGEKLTTTGRVSGTPAYMAPEQALGRLVDGRVDLYSLGIILFEMVTGRIPFEHADVHEQMRMQVKVPAPRLDELLRGHPWCTPQLVALVDGALVKDPDRRFANARVMMEALDGAFQSLDHVE